MVLGSVAKVLSELLGFGFVGLLALAAPVGTGVALSEDLPSAGDLQFVIHCGYSLQRDRFGVNNFRADFFRNKFHANRLEIRSWHANC